MALLPTGPYPVLTLFGEQGSGKSTLSRVLRLLIDPNLALVRSSPREERDLVITAGNCHLIALDNISRLPEWLSDALCRVATGAGFATRQLFTDAEEMLFQAQKPIILNGIEEFAQRPDLVDRAIILQLPQIDKKRRQHEQAMNTEFEAKRPQILGALLDIICMGLSMLDDVELEESPRMADFARWGCAIAEGCGWKQQDFNDAYERNRERANEASLESSIVANKIIKFLDDHNDDWQGRATDLLEALNNSTSEEIRKRKDWPKQPNVLSNALRRIAPSLRERGIGCEFGRSKQRIITLTPAPAERGASADDPRF